MNLITDAVSLSCGIGLALFLAQATPACDQTQEAKLARKHTQSSVYGLKRRVTFYPAQGSEPRVWEGTFKIEVEGSTIRFLDGDKIITIMGSVLVEELP